MRSSPVGSAHRQPAARRGLLVLSGFATGVLCGSHERPRRRASWLYIGEIERVELRPQNLAFALQRSNHCFLLIASAGMICHPFEREMRVLGSLLQPSCKVVQTA